MRATDVHAKLLAEFGNSLVSRTRADGIAYFWRAVATGPHASSRLLRITRNADGGVAEVKLAQSSIAAGREVLMPLPATPEDVVAAAHRELSGLLGK